MDGQNFDPSFGKLPDPFKIRTEAPELSIVQPKLETPKLSPIEFYDDEINKSNERGSMEFASGVVRVSDASTYDSPPSNKSIYGDTLGVTRATELRAAVGLTSEESFTEYYRQNQFVPKGFELDAKILLREEKVKKMEKDVAEGRIGYNTFLFRAYGEDLLKADGHDLRSTLYWFNRRKQGMMDSPIDNIAYLQSILQQSEAMYQREVWYSERNTRSVRDSFLSNFEDQNKLPDEKIADLFKEQFDALDDVIESDAEILRLYRAGLLKDFNPTIDEDGDGKIDWYLHRNGMLYKVYDAGQGTERGATAYYNKDGSLNRIEAPDIFGVYIDQAIQGFAGSIAGVADLVIYGLAGLWDLAEFFGGDTELDALGETFKNVESFKAGQYLFGNNVYQPNGGWTNSDGSINFEGIAFGTARAAGFLAGMFALTKGATLLSNAGVMAVKGTTGAVAKTITKKGLGYAAARTVGNAINGIVGLGQGVYSGGKGVLLSATQSTVRGLGFLAIKDFTTTVGALEANKAQLGIETGEILIKSAVMAGMNFGLSFFLRSVGDTPALTRLATWQKAKVRSAANIKSRNLLTNSFSTKILEWSKDAGRRQSFIITNSVMDMMENFLTMGTQTSLATTGEIFDGKAWAGLLDPQNIALQGFLFAKNVAGGLRGDDAQMGVAGIVSKMGNLEAAYEDVIANYLDRASKLAAEGKNAAADVILKEVERARQIRAGRSDKNVIKGTQDALIHLHETFKTNDDVSAVRKSLMKKYKQNAMEEISLATEAAFEQFGNLVKARNDMVANTFLTGDLFDQNSDIYKSLTSDKLKKIESVTNGFVQALKRIRFFDGATGSEVVKLITTNNALSVFKNRDEVAASLEEANAEPVSLGDIFVKTTVKNKKTGVEEVKYTIKNEFLDKVDKDVRQPIIDGLIKYVTEKLNGNTEALSDYFIIVPKNPGAQNSEGQKRYVRTLEILKTMADVISEEVGVEGSIRIFERLGELDAYLIPGMHLGLAQSANKTLNAMAINLFTLKYGATEADRAEALRYLYENVTDRKLVDALKDPKEAKNVLRILNKLSANGFLTTLQLANIISDPTIKASIENNKMNISGVKLEKINEALLYSASIEKIKALQEDIKNIPKNGQISPELHKRIKSFVEYFDKLDSEVQQRLIKEGFVNKAELAAAREANPKSDVARLKRLFESSRTGLEIDPNNKEDLELIRLIEEEFINSEGFKEKYSEEAGRILRDTLEKRIANEKNEFKKSVLSGILKKVTSNQSLNITDEALRKTIIEEVSKASPDLLNKWGLNETEIEDIVFEVKDTVFKQVFFEDQVNDVIYNKFVYDIYYKSKKGKVGFTFDEFNKNKSKSKTLSPRVEVLKVALKEQDLTKLFIENARESERFELAAKLFSDWFTKETVDASSSFKIVLNVNELVGSYWKQIQDKLSNPSVRFDVGDEIGNVEKVIEILFGKDFSQVAKVELAKQLTQKENLPSIYRDTLENTGGFLAFDFYVEDGRVVFKDLDQRQVLVNILNKLGYEVYDLENGLQNIPGVYFNTESSSKAMSLEFNTAEEKNRFLRSLRSRTIEIVDQKIKGEIKSNLDYRERLIERTGGAPYINEDTVFTFADIEYIPAFVGQEGTEANPFKIQYVTSVFDAFRKGEIKQGKLGGLLIKAYAMSRFLPGAVSDVDANLQSNLFFLHVIDALDGFSKKIRDTKTEETFNQTIVYLTDQEVQDFKNNGDLFEILKVQNKIKGEDYAQYVIRPKENFKELALTYLKNNPNNVQLKYILPLAFYDKPSSYEVAYQEYIKSNNLDNSGNVLMANTRRLERNSSGPDMIIDVHNNIGKIYSEQFIQRMYEGPMAMSFKTELNGKVLGEQEVINAVKGKTYKEIIELNNNPEFRNNIYYTMLYRQLLAGKFFTDQVLFGELGFGFDSANKDLAVLLSDPTVKTILADGLEEIQKISDSGKKEKAKEALVKKINKFILEQDKQERVKIYTLEKDVGGLQDFEAKETDQVDSYKLESLGLKNKLTGSISVADINDIIDTFENDYEFYRSTSFKSENRLQDPVITKLLSMLETADSVDNKLNIFVEDLFRMSPEEFTDVMKLLRESGAIKKSSLDALENKFNSIKDNSTYYREVYNQTFRKNYTYEEGLIKLHNVPSTSRRNDIAVIKNNDPTSKENFRNALRSFVDKPVSDPLAEKSQIKVSQSDLGNFKSANIMRLFKNMIEEDMFSTFGASRLMNNLSHARFLGEFIYNIVGSAKALKDFMVSKDPSLTNSDYIKIAMTLFKQSSGVAYDRSFPAFFLYDKQTKKVVGIDGTGNSKQALDKIGMVYFRDIESETSDRYWMFNVDKNAFNSTGSDLREGFRVLELNKENKEKVKAIVSNYILKEVGALRALENESQQDKIIRVLTRNPTMRDKFNYVKQTLAKNSKVKALFDKMGERATNRLVKGLFLTGENVRVGSPNFSLALQRTITSVRWDDPSYRSDVKKQNNLIRNLNNFVYLIDPEDVSYSFNTGKRKAERRYNDSINERFNVVANKTEGQNQSDYKNKIKNIFRSMNEDNVMSIKSRNQIEALVKSYSNIFTQDQIVQDIFSYYVYNKDNGATINFLMLDNDINNIVTRSLTTDDAKVLNGRFDFRSLVNQELYFGDVESLGDMVYEVSFIKSNPVEDIKDALANPNKYFADQGKKILIPMFYNGRFLNSEYLNELVPGNLKLEDKIKQIMPEFYKKFIKDNKEVTMRNLENYFKTIDKVVKNIEGFETKGIKSVEDYLIKEAKAYGYTNEGKDLPLLVSFNGASFDFGRDNVEGILFRSRVLSSNKNIFNENHLDVLQDIIQKRFISKIVFEDQQKNSLSFLANKFGVNVLNAHDSIEDVKTLAKVLFVLSNDYRNTNKITSNLLVTLQDIYRVGTGEEINKETILKIGQGLEKISDEDIDDERTIVQRNLYKEIFKEENVSEFNDALGKSMSVVKDYLDTIERDVFRKKVNEMVNDELGSKIKVFENIQNNTSKFLPSIIEYYIRKKYPNAKFNSNDIESFAKKGAEAQSASGYLLGDVYNLFKNAFGTKYEDTSTTSISQFKYDEIFSIESEEELFIKIGAAAQVEGIKDFSYEDYLKSKQINNGDLIRSFAENFLNGDMVLSDGEIRTGREYIQLVNENEMLRRDANGFENTTEEIFTDVFKGMPEDVVFNILNKAAKTYLRNANLDEVAYAQRVRLRGLTRDNKFLSQVKNLLNKYSFGSNFRRNEFYDRVTAMDRSKEYFVYDNNGNVVRERLNAFDIAMSEEMYKDLTGISYQDSLKVFYPQDIKDGIKNYRSVPLNIIRYPQDGVGRQAVLNVRILAPGSEQFSNKPIMNLDVLKAFLSGDTDGDSISVLQPTKGSVAFNNSIKGVYNLTFDIFGEAFDLFLNSDGRRIPSKLSAKDSALFDFELQKNFASKVVQDLNKLNKENANFNSLREIRKEELTEMLIKSNLNLTTKEIDEVLDLIWIKQFDITEFIKSETGSPFTYYSSNIYGAEIESNKNAYLAINAAKIYNFDKQAAADIYSGFKQKLANKLSEKISSEDPRSLFNYAAFDLSDGTYGIINRDLTLFKGDLIASLEKRKDNIQKIAGENNYNFVFRLVSEAETAPEIAYAMQFLNKVVMESETTKDSFVSGYNQYRLLDKEILDSIKNENESVIEAFAILTGAFNSEAKFDPKDLDMQTFASKMEKIFELISHNNAGNYWASSNNSFRRNEGFKLEIQKIINTENKSSVDYKKMHENIYDIVDEDNDSGFRSDMHVNALVLINQAAFGENIELDSHKVVVGNKQYGASSISLWKFYTETVDQDDAKTLLGLTTINKKVLTSDVKLTNGKTIPSGAKIENVIYNPDGSLSVSFSFKRGYDADLKFTVPGTKNFKSTLGGEVNRDLENSIRESEIEADFVFGQESFKQKNATPFFNKILKNRIDNGLVVYYKVEIVDGVQKFVQTDSIKDADAYMIKQMPAMISQESFFRKDLKERFTDDIAISTGRRNLTSSVITKDYLFEIDGNEIKFSDKIIGDGYKAFETFNQPTLLENNAAALHAYLLNSILIKYLDIEPKEKQKLFDSLRNYSSSELMDLFGELMAKHVKGNKNKFMEEKLTPMEKIIFSEELYQGFLNNGNPRILKNVADLEFVSRKESFARKNSSENEKLRNFKVSGALARDLATSKYKDNIVISESFGNMGMVEYLQFLIGAYNKSYDKDVSRLSRKKLQNLSIAKILNLGTGVGGSIYDNFKTLDLDDSKIIEDAQLIGYSGTSSKTLYTIPSPTMSIESGVLKRSNFSESGTPRELQEDFTNQEYSLYKTFDQETGTFKRKEKTVGPELNVDFGNGNKRLFRAEARFLSNILGAVSSAKDTYERASLFGYNPNIYLPFSLTNIGINPNDKRIQLAYTPDFISTNLKDVNQALRNKINSDRFLDVLTHQGKDLRDSIKKSLTSKNFSEINGKILEAREKEEAESVMRRGAIFGDQIENERMNDLLRGLNAEEDYEDSVERRLRKRIEYEEDMEALTTMFKSDLLASGGIKVTGTLELEVERMVKDYVTNQKFFMKKFSTPLEALADMAVRYGAYEDLQKYAAFKYYDTVIPKLETDLAREGIKESDKLELEMLLKNYKEEKEAMLGRYQTSEDFLKFFEKAYSPLITLFNQTNKILGEQFRAYSIVTDQASDLLLYLLKPKVKKGFEKAEQVLSKVNMFTYNDESLFKARDLSTPNYFINMFDKIGLLTKQATIYTMSEKMKSLGLMANKSLMEYVENSLLDVLETEAKNLRVSKYEDSQEFLDNQKQYFDDVIKFVPKEEAGSYNLIKEQFVRTESIGDNLLNLLKRLNQTLYENKVPSKNELEKTMRTADKNSKEWEAAYNMSKLYEYKEQTLIMLTNMIDSRNDTGKSVLNSVYEGIKVLAEKNNVELTDKFGRKITEDPTKYKALFPGSTNEIKHLVKFSYFGGGFEKNIALDALNGDVFFTNKSLAEFLDKEVFTTKMPNTIVKSIAKLNGITSKLIMSNPFRFVDRLIGFTMYDIATLASSEPATMLKVGRSINEVSAMLQSGYSVISPELQEFLIESGMSVDKTKLNEIFADFNPEKNTSKLLDNPYFDIFEKGFSAQNIVGRYAYWLAVKEKFDKNKSINYGPSYYVKKAIDGLTNKEDDDGNGEVLVSASGRKAMYMLSNILGSPGDFPIMAKKLKGLVMFSTFPLAAARFARNMLASSSSAIKDLMMPGNRSDAFRWLTGTALGTAGLFAIPWLIFEVWGNLLGLEDEEEEKWKEDAGMPELFRTVFSGSPVINKFNTFNQYALLDSMTIKPFRDAMSEGGTFFDGLGRFFIDNIASRAPAPAKLLAETLGGVDTFGGTIRDNTDQWSMWENFQRKLLGYVIGGSGANALTTYLNKDAKYENTSFVDLLSNGFTKVVQAEMGNTTAYKADVRNYYKANSIIQNERFANTETDSYSDSSFNLEKYRSVRSEIGRALRRKAKPSVIYGIIVEALQEGIGMAEVRSALRNNSLEYKLSTIENIDGFIAGLSESDYKTISDAIAWERQNFPFLDEYVTQMNDLYKKNYGYQNTPRKVYIPRVYNNTGRYPARLDTNGYLRNVRFNPYFRIQDPFKAYRSAWYNVMNFDDEER